MVKGRISKRVLQENKARRIFRKMHISYSDTHMYVYVLGVKCSFIGKLGVFFSWNSRFEIRSFTLLPTIPQLTNVRILFTY